MIRLQQDAVRFDMHHRVDAWILVVTTPTCQWCPKVKALLSEVDDIPVSEVSARGAISLMDDLQIQAAPTTILFWGGDEIERVVGYDSDKQVQIEMMISMAREMGR